MSSLAVAAVLIVNGLVFLFGCAMTGLSLTAYRATDGNDSYRWSTVGFALITVGCVVEPVFQYGIRRDWEITGAELLYLQAMEGAFFALGLGILFVSIYRYGRGEADTGTERMSAESTRDSETVRFSVDSGRRGESER